MFDAFRKGAGAGVPPGVLPTDPGPDMGAHIRHGLSNMLYAPTTPEEVACSPLLGTTCLPYGPPCPACPSGAVGNRSLDNTSFEVLQGVPTRPLRII